jgi:hypothetical protein
MASNNGFNCDFCIDHETNANVTPQPTRICVECKMHFSLCLCARPRTLRVFVHSSCCEVLQKERKWNDTYNGRPSRKMFGWQNPLPIEQWSEDDKTKKIAQLQCEFQQCKSNLLNLHRSVSQLMPSSLKKELVQVPDSLKKEYLCTAWEIQEFQQHLDLVYVIVHGHISAFGYSNEWTICLTASLKDIPVPPVTKAAILELDRNLGYAQEQLEQLTAYCNPIVLE